MRGYREPQSPNFATTIVFEFTANTLGTFTYYCFFHQFTMFGTFTVNPTPYNSANRPSTRALQQVSLNPGQQKTLTFIWNTTGVAKGSTINAVAATVLSETNIADNTLTIKGVTVAMVGDIIPDGVIDIFDLVTVATHFGHSPPDGHTPGTQAYFACFNADVIEDGIVDIFDLVAASTHFGQTDP